VDTRTVLRRAHRGAGIVAFLTILAFWTATLGSELFADVETVARVKRWILWGMIVLVPAMAVAGGSGFRLAGGSTAKTIEAKKRRMPFIALNGLLILLPSAVFLASRAAAGNFDGLFYLVQGIELVAGALNLTLIGLNIRDGLALSGRVKRRPVAAR
jgi:hypothetical protein